MFGSTFAARSYMHNLFFVVLVFVFSGCGSEESALIELNVRFPASIAKNSKAYQKLLSRAESMQLSIQSKEGYTYENHFPPLQWETIVLPQMEFPKSQGDVLSIQVKVWDRKNDGTKRTYPVLVGKTSLKAKDLKPGVVSVPIKLSLQVSVENL